jgi:hypothetical protein
MEASKPDMEASKPDMVGNYQVDSAERTTFKLSMGALLSLQKNRYALADNSTNRPHFELGCFAFWLKSKKKACAACGLATILVAICYVIGRLHASRDMAVVISDGQILPLVRGENLLRPEELHPLVFDRDHCPQPPCIRMGSHGSNLEYFARHFPILLAQAVGDKQEFFCNLAGNLSVTHSMLLREGCLGAGLNVFIGSKGGVFHPDLDRCATLQSHGSKSLNSLPTEIRDAFVRTLAVARLFVINATSCSSPLDSTHEVYQTQLKDQVSMEFPEGLEAVHGTCGQAKCYYPTSWGGYLLASGSRSAKSMSAQTLSNWELAWEFGNRLKLLYGAEHLLTSPPTQVAISREWVDRLNGNNSYLTHSYAVPTDRFKPDRPVLVQKVSDPESPGIVMGSHGSKLAYFEEHFPVFLARAVGDKREFYCNLADNLSATASMLKREACLAMDFQLYIGSKGGVFHLDLDRCQNLRSGDPRTMKRLPGEIRAAFIQMVTTARRFVINATQGVSREQTNGDINIHCSTPLDPILTPSGFDGHGG